MKNRTAEIETKTKETSICVFVNLDGMGKCKAKTGTKFLDHMITSLATHSMIDITMNAKGDLRHHIIEDCAIALGRCISKALGDRSGIARFGYAFVPMDESLGFAAIDLVKRNYFVMKDLALRRNMVEDLPREDLEHFFRSLCDSMVCTLHLGVEYGSNDHHKVEASFKALAISLRQALQRDSKRNAIPSSKGSM